MQIDEMQIVINARLPHALFSDKSIKHLHRTLKMRESAMYVFTYRYTYQKLYIENFDMIFPELIRSR
jgi:hypothetical protein